MGCQNGLIARTIKILRLDLLSLLGIQKLQIGLGDLARAMAVHVLVEQRHRRLGENGVRGIDDLELAGLFLQRQMRLVPRTEEHRRYRAVQTSWLRPARRCRERVHGCKPRRRTPWLCRYCPPAPFAHRPRPRDRTSARRPTFSDWA